MLRLMVLDPLPVLYLGRPCYFGLALDPPCSPLDWTLGRFGPRIVDSMVAVIEQSAGNADAIELFGHSGGGALAVLLARRLEKVTRVVTLAGNLDPDAWAALHGYTPMRDSEKPLDGGPLRKDLTQVHYAGALDRNVPPELLKSAVPKLGSGRLVVVAGADHTCCWSDVWPAVLAGLPVPDRSAELVPQAD
jgi:pimeloyl-ACP methyl ester carboxylesterase